MISDQSQNITQNNSWQFGTTTSDKQNGGIGSYADFVADMSDNVVANQLASVARNVDGTIPDNGFCRLKSTSDCIDKGQLVSYSFLDKSYPVVYNGTAPDLGAYEYNVPTGVFAATQSFSDLQISGNSDISKISFSLENNARVSLRVLDMTGKTVLQCLNNQLMPSGNNYHIAYFGNLPHGNYMVSLYTEKFQKSIKFIR